MVGGRTAAALWSVASKTCSILLAAFLCSCRQAVFSSRLVSVHVVHPYSSIDTTAAWKKLRFILSVRSDFHMTNNLLIAVHTFVSCVSMSVSVDETLLHCWRSREELISDVLLWTPSLGRAKAGRPDRNYIHVRIRGFGMMTYRKRWRIGRGGEKGSGISALMARQDDDESWFEFRVFLLLDCLTKAKEPCLT